jgi:hypothetical protein
VPLTPTSLVVEHISANGRHYSRDEPYTRSNLTFTPGRIEYYWTGTMVRNPAQAKGWQELAIGFSLCF